MRCRQEIGSFSAKVLEHGIGQAKVAFRTSKSIGLTLCGMVEGDDFTSLDLLLEETEGDVTPDIAIEVNQDAVGAGKGIEQFSSASCGSIWMV